MSKLTLAAFEEALRKASALIDRSKQINAIYVWEGTLDPRSPKHWRNRPGIQKFFSLAGLPLNDIGASAGDIPVIASPAMLPGKIMLAMGDGKLLITDEPSSEEPEA